MPAQNEMTPEELKKELKKKLQRAFTTQLKQVGITVFEEEYLFSDKRKWRFDIMIPIMTGSHITKRILIDLQGGTYSGGAHVRGKGYRNDVEKMNAATVLGFSVYWFTGDMIEDESAITFLLDYILIDYLQ